MQKKYKLSKKLKHWTKVFSIMILGSLISAYTYHALVVPHGLLAGGISGISIMIDYLTGFPYVRSMIVLNIPILIWGLKRLNMEYMLLNICGILFGVIAIHLTKSLFPVPIIDRFLASVSAGVLYGISTGLFFRFHISSGGTDTIGAILKKRKNISAGATAFGFNIVVMAASLFFFDVGVTLYTMLSIYVCGRITNAVINGFSNNKSCFIISDYGPQIGERINREIGRGVTYLKGSGAYTNTGKIVVNSVVTNYEIAVLKEIIHEVDPHAFMYFMDAAEVNGKGF